MQVQGELKKMEAFITKEAEEKAKEIKLKADEEYEIEKASIVRSEKNAIDSQYEDKFKKASLAQQITKSTIANKTRLKILATRDQCLQDIFDSAEEQLKQLSKDPATYESLLVGLIDEGLLQLMEPAVTLRVRKADVSVTKKAADQAEKKFKDVSGRDVKITIDETKYLSDKSAGGLILANGTGKIEINNTLEERLRLLSERALPAVRLEMFGVSTTRKFFD
ncbi:V-ATPase V1 sector subunit E [Brettanomyces bruxellensis]|uniref:V-ATPase V1 sector subunit E n=2 Tax=Dekkera bruxellensis TaxID=5007 RepID=A0A871R581_DEKBR|nr:V-ATPase V1 sector subunit E [Brettanomyces bruxellensis]QOU21703.1 V-ATPase V1 sector subunit E [Brettanomyces bruxellensis]